MEDTSLLNEYLSLIEDSPDGYFRKDGEIHINTLLKVFELYRLEDWLTVTEVVTRLLYYFDMDTAADNVDYVISATFIVRDNKLTLRYRQKEEYEYVFALKDRYQRYLVCKTINANTRPKVNLWNRRNADYKVIIDSTKEHKLLLDDSNA